MSIRRDRRKHCNRRDLQERPDFSMGLASGTLAFIPRIAMTIQHG